MYVPGVHHSRAGRHTVGIAGHGPRLRKPPRVRVRLGKPPLAVRAKPFRRVAEPFGLRLAKLRSATVPVDVEEAVAVLTLLTAARHIEGTFPSFGRRGASVVQRR